MHFRALNVGSFRLFQEKKVEFYPGINFIIGKNGIGKTSLLEALFLLIAGKSFRSSNLNEMRGFGESSFKVEAHFEKWGIPGFLKWVLQGDERKIWHNNSEVKSLCGLIGIMQGVLIAPHDIELIMGAPAIRRHYLDFQMSQVDPLYLHHLMRYTKGLKQRNAQLRLKKIQAIEIFEEMIARSAKYITEQRELAAQELSSGVCRFYQEISGFKVISSLKMISSFSGFSVEKIMEKLKNNRLKEMELGFTQVGIHRDDFSLQINEKPAKNFASEGEKRSLVASLKLAEWERICQKTGAAPILLVDDMGISLDPNRQDGLFKIFSRLGQVIITTSQSHSSFANSGHYSIIDP